MKKDIRNDLGYYVEGDYMAEENTEKECIYISSKDKNGCRLVVTKDRIINLEVPHDDMSVYQFEFNSKEDWEGFLETIWNTENYMAVKKKDFIEFFQALRHLHGHHCRQLDVVAGRQKQIDKEIAEQQDRLGKLKQILSNYEYYYMEVYNENKV